MVTDDYEKAIASFIRTKGVTRCPTACVLPTQGTVSAADREALERYALAREARRANGPDLHPVAPAQPLLSRAHPMRDNSG